MEALIVYYSKKGTTRRFAEAIAYQVGKRIEKVRVKTIEEVTSQDIINCDILYMGCWTSGKFLFGQKPEQPWVDFVSKLPRLNGKQTVLFTTYALTSGSMFRKMKKYLTPKGFQVIGSMKSRSGKFDYFSIGVLRYSLYNLVARQVSNLKVLEPEKEPVLEPAM